MLGCLGDGDFGGVRYLVLYIIISYFLERYMQALVVLNIDEHHSQRDEDNFVCHICGE